MEFVANGSQGGSGGIGGGAAVKAQVARLIQWINELKQSINDKNIAKFLVVIQQIFPAMKTLNASVSVQGRGAINAITQYFTKLVIVARSGNQQGANDIISAIEKILQGLGDSEGKLNDLFIDELSSQYRRFNLLRR